MPVPSPRNPIRPARGNLSDLQANIANLYEGEICYALDSDSLYIKEGSTLIRVTDGSQQGDILNSNIQSPVVGESLNYDGSFWVNGGPQDGGNF